MTITMCLGAGMFLCLPLSVPPGEEEPEVFEIVSIRNASDVAAVMPPEGFDDDILGQTIAFSGEGLEMKGVSCDAWQREPLSGMPINMNDPMLADAVIGPIDSPTSTGDARIMKSWRYVCEGEHVMSLTRVDERVLIIPWGNGVSYLIAEKPIPESGWKALQGQLHDMKFLSAEPTGKADENTIRAISLYAEYRLKSDGIVPKDEIYAFQRPAITENLLDGMGILPFDEAGGAQ